MTTSPGPNLPAGGAAPDLSRGGAAGVLRRHWTAPVVPVVVGAALLFWLVVSGVAPGGANVAASAAGLTSYLALRRRRAWRHRDPVSPSPERHPFCAVNITGLVLSTTAVHVVGLASQAWLPGTRAAVTDLAALSVYGALWLAAFSLRDRAVWAAERPGAAVG